MERLQQSLKRRSKFLLGLIVTAIVVITITVAALIGHGSKNSSHFFSGNVVSAVHFPLYYPSRLPEGYIYDQKQTILDSGTLFFVLKNKSSEVNISEQVGPSPAPDLDSIKKYNTSFKDLDIDAGSAIIGVDIGTKSPVVIVSTNTTLINIHATANTPTDQLKEIARGLKSESL